MKRTHSWNKGVLLLSRFAGALLLAAFAVSCKQNVDTPKTEMFSVTFSASAKEYGTLTATLDDRPFTGGNVAAGKTVTFTAQANAGYEVERWTVNGTAVANNTTASYNHKVTAKTDVKVFFKAAGNTKYTVRHLQEGVDGTYTKGEEEPKTGTTGKNTAATAKTYAGFITPATVAQKPIAADGSTVIEIKYARKEITLTFNLAGGNINGKTDSVTVKGKYEAAVTKPAAPKKDGYTFSGWNPELPETFPAENATYTAQWAREGDYTITYNLNDGTDNGGNPASYNVETATITLKPAGRTGYKFKGWYSNKACTGTSVEKIEKGSTGNKTFWAKWEPKTDTRYTVQHLQEGLDGTYTKHEEEAKTGTTGKNTAATAKTYAGFITPTVDQKPIAADGSTVIEIKYARKEITLTFNLAGGTINGKTDSVTVKGKYEAAVTKPAKPTKTGYTFSGWNHELPETFPAEDATYTAQWAKLHSVAFTVEGTPPNGTLTATLDSKPFTGGNVAEGKTVEFTAVPSSSNYGVNTWTITGSSFIDGTGSDGSTTARVKITANTQVRVGFIPLPGKYIPVSFGENGTGLKNHLYNRGNAASDGIYYIEVTGLTTSDVKKGWLEPSPLGKVLMDNASKKVALKLGAIPSLTDMSGCFQGCTNLVQAPVIPNGVTDMSWCFSGCTSLTQAPVIPSSVTDMNRCFSGCTSLVQAPEIPNSVTDMSWCFFGCTSLTQAPVIPSSVTDMNRCFYGCVSLVQAPVIPNGVTDMSGCFDGCERLTQAPVIPNSVTDMGDCFYGCTSLMQAPMIPNGVTNMGGCFRGCTSLTSLTVDSSNTKYGSEGNTIYTKDTNTLVCVAGGLTSVTIPNDVTKIEWGAFDGCIHLTAVELPARIDEISGKPFSSCTNLTTLTVDSGNTKYGSANNMIYTKDTNRLVCVAPGLEGSVTVPPNVQSIDHFAFFNCTKLESVTISNGVSSIRKTAFENCKRLTRITIPKTVSFIGESVICNSPNAEIVLAEGIISSTINIERGAFGVGEKKENLCKTVKIKDDENYEALKNKVVASSYPENRIEKY